MPCLKCDSLIPNGTSVRIANGLMCAECLPQDTVDFLQNKIHLNITSWYYYKEVDRTTNNHRYILTDQLTYQSYDMLRGVYYVYPLNQASIVDATNMDRCEYLILNDGCKVQNTIFSNCTIIARGDLHLIDSSVYSLYVTNSFHIALANSQVGYMRGVSGSSFPTITFTIDNSAMPADCSEVYIKYFTAKHITTELAVHNLSSNFEAYIENCHIPRLHICSNVLSLTIHNSIISEYDNGEYCTTSLSMSDSTLHLYDHSHVTNRTLVSSTIIVVPTVLCTMCNRPIKGDTIMVKGNQVHSECMRRGSYSFRDFKTIGTSTKLPPFGFELELRHNQYQEPQEYVDAIYDLIMHGFKRCSDSTVNDEMKSPILRSDKWVLDIAPTLDKLAKSYIDDRCGTHIHVSTNSYVLTFLRRRSAMFNTLSEYMHENEESTRYIWGRYFNNQYAQFLVESDERTSWLNITGGNHQTIEYRLAQMRDVEQFQRLIYFCRLLTMKLHSIYEDSSSKKIVYTSKLGNEILRFYQKFEANTLRGVK